jgi:cell division septation protein DedD
MAGGGKRGGGDRVLESRHLVGLFLGVVLLCGVFFTLGYVMGHTQYGGSVHAETLTRRPTPVPAAEPSSADKKLSPAPAPSEWDFYNKKADAQPIAAVPAKAADENPEISPSLSTPPDITPSKSQSAAAPASRIAKGSIVLQVAALRHQSDALAMAGLLQKKRFPSFVSAPVDGDTLYRVQVGPYADERSADEAKAALDHDGFKAIIKH